ncbi:putative ABC transport system permease protein [Parabacteroides sp. PM5-20]|uniref:ABC transporter permease n=1 Tax=unclassified Parabacteroides TaxID=2649774 RepID=UPI0013D5CE27|nr:MULTISPECIES: FtsX-like permease family protein [unclassified Parabacteroides]MDH6533410.1 putative ABC transport system permease protein [Parabacteroides sp. PM5-20]
MWRTLLKQMWNRRRSNIWIALELLFVFCLVWYIVDYLFVYNYNLCIPDHRDMNHTLQVNLAELPEEHPEYRAEESEGEAKLSNYKRIIRVIEDFPGVESLAVSFYGGAPGSGSYSSRTIINSNDTTLYSGGQWITIDPTYDFFGVFKYTTDNGNKSVSTADFDWDAANGIVIGQQVKQSLFREEPFFRKEVEGWRRPESRYLIIGVVDDIKRFDYNRPQSAIYAAQLLQANNVGNAEISIRHTSTVSTQAFREKFKTEIAERLRIGNYYLLSVIPYTKIGEDTKQVFGVTNDIRLRLYLMFFFLANILLCVMGTFWYRINQRPAEIGLRKALGATRISIHGSLVLEALLLLALVTIPAMIIEYQFIHTDVIRTLGRQGAPNPAYLPDRTLLRFLITNGITFVFMAFITTIATWLPARKGAFLAPAEALHHE